MLKIKPIRQRPGYCGVASLKMVLEYFGLQISEQRLIKLTGANPQKGTSAEGMEKAVQALGLSFFIKDNASFEDIKFYLDKKIPPIVDWFSLFGGYAKGHYSVVVGLDKNYIYLQDPEIAKIRKMAKKEFLCVWFDFEGEYLMTKEDLKLRRLIVVSQK